MGSGAGLVGDALGLAIASRWLGIACPAAMHPPLRLASGNGQPDLVPVLPGRLSAAMAEAIDPLVVAEYPHFVIQQVDGTTEIRAEPVVLLDTVQALLQLGDAAFLLEPSTPDETASQLAPVAACVRPARIVEGGHAAALEIPVLFTHGDEGLYHQMLPLAGGAVYVRECSARSARPWLEPTGAICAIESSLTRMC